MSESENTKMSKREYWQHQIKKWEESNISQSNFCQQVGIKLSTFVYWRVLLQDSKNKTSNSNKFAPVKIIKDESTSKSDTKIQIKLLTGHIVYLPLEIGIHEISRLIHSLGLPHA